MGPLVNGLLSTAFALAVLVPIDVWVFVDARRRARSGRSVTLRLGDVEVAAPAQWLAGSLVLFVLFVPAYLVARKQA